MRNGTAFTEPFSYTYYYNTSNDRLDSLTGGGYNFIFSRYTNDIFSSNLADFTINTTSKTSTTGSVDLYMTFEKPLANNKIFSFTGNTSSASATGLSYNASTGLFSGNFNITIPGSQNNTGNPATITGSFQVNVMETVYIKHQDGMIKTN